MSLVLFVTACVVVVGVVRHLYRMLKLQRHMTATAVELANDYKVHMERADERLDTVRTSLDQAHAIVETQTTVIQQFSRDMEATAPKVHTLTADNMPPDDVLIEFGRAMLRNHKPN